MVSDGAVLAVDVGGTFTDAVVVTGGERAAVATRRVFTAKTPTTSGDQSAGVIVAARDALAGAGVAAGDVTAFIHGMTVTTNALLEGRFARTALLATAGFTDIEQLGRQNRASLYRLCAAGPEPIVPAELRFAVHERCGPDGVLTPLDERSLRVALAACAAADVESIAVCLLFSFRHPRHELRVRELAGELLPGVHVSLSHEVVGTFREYERCATTIADAALSPLLAGYLHTLRRRAAAAGLPAPEVMLSNGGSAPAEVAARNAATTVLSGPAGGAVGAARAVARRTDRALAFDMGGTSTDICVIRDGAVSVTAARAIDGRPIALPATDIFTVGAGGGSIAWRDSGGALRVGPRSAGARPGPACYGAGGLLPTVTDANLLLGYLAADASLAGGPRLGHAAAEGAIAELAARLGVDATAAAAGIVRIANHEMLRAIGAATIARGIDPRDHTLVAFGGAGPMHASAIADALQIQTVVCPAACGVLSALGMAVAGRRRDRSRSIVRRIDQLDAGAIKLLIEQMRAEAGAELGDPPGAKVAATFELRYVGQAFELSVEHAVNVDLRSLATAFHAEHERRYGFCDVTAPVELVTLRVSVASAPTVELSETFDAATPDAETFDAAAPDVKAPDTASPGPEANGNANPAPAADEPSAPATRPAWFDGAWRETTVIAALSAGGRIAGPAVIEQPHATIVIPPSWHAIGEHDGAVTLYREAGDSENTPPRTSPAEAVG